MKKCLVTKLKGVVSSDLPFLGALCVKPNDIVPSSASQRRIVIDTSDTNCEVFTNDGSSILSQNSDLSNPTNRLKLKEQVKEANGYPFYILDGGAKVNVSNKYSITQISVWGNTGPLFYDINLDSLMYMNKLTNLMFDNASVIGDLSSLVDITSLVDIVMKGRGIKVSGDISSLSKLTSLKRLSFSYFNTESNVSGDISSLSDLISLNNVTFNEAGKLHGTFEKMIEGMCKKRTSETCKFYFPKSSVTFNGKAWAGTKYVEFSSSGCEIYEYQSNTKGDKLATYVKTTNTWSYVG